jgi:hypothetical protein
MNYPTRRHGYFFKSPSGAAAARWKSSKPEQNICRYAGAGITMSGTLRSTALTTTQSSWRVQVFLPACRLTQSCQTPRVREIEENR